jgi:hypothetical protein
LTVYHSSLGVIERTQGNTYQAKLNTSDADVTYFSDLPDRQANRMNAKEFFNMCQKGLCCSLKNNGELIYVDSNLKRIELPISIQSVKWISKGQKDYLVVDFSRLSKIEAFKSGEIKDVVFLVYQHCY